MSKAETAPIESEAEVISTTLPVNQDKMDALIAAAGKIEELGKALDKFRTFVLQRALPGDWVSFKEKGSDDETLELTGAATDRIAAALGINFVEFSDSKESWTDEKGPAYTWRYKNTTVWQGRRIEGVEGRASSRDKFFGIAYGQLKALADISEGDVRTAARRNSMKEGVKLMLGLRRIPKSAAAAMGLDLTKVRSVEFGSKKTGDAVKDGDGSGTVNTEVVDVTVKRQQPEQKDEKGKVTKKGYTIYSIKTKAGDYDTFEEKVAKFAKEHKGKAVTITFSAGKYGRDLTGIEPFVEQTKEA